VKLAVAATFRTRLALAVAVRAFHFCHVDESIQRFFGLLCAEDFDLIEKPQWISGAVAVADEPLMEARIACAWASFGEDVPVAEASRAIVFLDASTVTTGTQRPESARRTSFAAQKAIGFFDR
jgi:hypothetical protein